MRRTLQKLFPYDFPEWDFHLKSLPQAKTQPISFFDPFKETTMSEINLCSVLKFQVFFFFLLFHVIILLSHFIVM